MQYFNPGCAVQIYKPEAAQKIFAFLKQQNPDVSFHEICCHFHPQVPEDSQIINACAGCDRRFRTLYEGISTKSLWEMLAEADDFPFPDYQGAPITIHDPCPLRKRPDAHQAVRHLLTKMNFQIIEAAHHGTNSECCGDSSYPDLPVDQIHANMRKRADTMPVEDVCVYCVSCINAIHTGGKTPRYLLDLLLAEATTPLPYDIASWHDHLGAYRLAHNGEPK